MQLIDLGVWIDLYDQQVLLMIFIPAQPCWKHVENVQRR